MLTIRDFLVTIPSPVKFDWWSQGAGDAVRLRFYVPQANGIHDSCANLDPLFCFYLQLQLSAATRTSAILLIRVDCSLGRFRLPHVGGHVDFVSLMACLV